MNLKQKAVAGAKWNSLSMVIVSSLQFIKTLILARLLSPSDFGLMGMIMVVIGFARLFSDMGISNRCQRISWTIYPLRHDRR